LKIVTLNLPDQYLACIKVLVDLGFYPSRSEAIRQALKGFLSKESRIIKEFEPINFETLKVHQMNALIGRE